MSSSIISFIQSSLGAYGKYVILVGLATAAFVYLVRQAYSLRGLSHDRGTKKISELKELVAALEKRNDLVAEELFQLIYGFNAQAAELRHICAAKYPSGFVSDLLSGRYMLQYNIDGERYEYKKHYKLTTRKWVLSVLYWVSSIMAYATFVIAIGERVYALMVFVPIFALTTYVALQNIKYMSAAARIIARYPPPKPAQNLRLVPQ